MTANTFVTSGSRAGIGSPVVADSATGNTYMISGLGAESVPITAVNISITGVAATSAVGTPTIDGDASITLTGVAATSAAGTPVIEVDKSVTGVSSTSAVGTPTIDGDASITLDGVEATSDVGDPTVELDDAALTGQAAVASVGTVVIEIDLTLDGVEATSVVGDPTTDIFFPVFVTGVYATPLVGLLLGTAVPIIGVEADTAIADVSVAIIDGAIIDGVEATLDLGTLDLQVDTNLSIIGVPTTLGLGTLHSVVAPVIDGVEITSGVGVPIPTNLQLASFLIQTALGTLAVTADNAVLLGVQAAAIVGFLNAVPSGNYTNVAISGVGAAVSLGIIASRIEQSVSLSGDAATASVGELTVATYVTGGLMMTDLTCETILQLPDDFSVTLRWSDTSGYSWSDSAIRSIGATGQYLTNPQWRRLGMSRRGRVWELSWSCPQATALQGATVMFVDASS